MKLAVTLIAYGCHVYDFIVEGKTVYLHFDPDEIADLERSFYLRELPRIEARMMLEALQKFRLLLLRTGREMSYLVSSREAVVALMSAGIKPLGLQSLEKMLYFEFSAEEPVKDVLLGIVNNELVAQVQVDDFWREYQYFSDALRSR